MNKLATWAIITVLFATTIIYGVLFVQNQNRINSLETQVSDLQSIETNVSNLQVQMNNFQGSITSIQSNLSSMNSAVSSIEDSNSQIQSQISSLQTVVSQLSEQVQTGEVNFSDTIKLVEPCLVRVDTDLGSGSGTIVQANGYVLTNQHVIDQARTIQITLMNGDQFTATVVKADTDLDVAVLQITSTRTDFPVVTIGSASDVIVGEEIMVGGFPGGEELTGPATFTMGFVSAIRNDPTVNINYVQIDAAVNPGNSGGGLFTIDGKLIGIPSYGIDFGGSVDWEGLNLAIPIEIFAPFIQSVIGS
jgi:serine protease Do